MLRLYAQRFHHLRWAPEQVCQLLPSSAVTWLFPDRMHSPQIPSPSWPRCGEVMVHRQTTENFPHTCQHPLSGHCSACADVHDQADAVPVRRQAFALGHRQWPDVKSASPAITALPEAKSLGRAEPVRWPGISFDGPAARQDGRPSNVQSAKEVGQPSQQPLSTLLPPADARRNHRRARLMDAARNGLIVPAPASLWSADQSPPDAEFRHHGYVFPQIR